MSTDNEMKWHNKPQRKNYFNHFVLENLSPRCLNIA